MPEDDWQKMNVARPDELYEDTVGWGLLTTAGEPYAMYLFKDTRRGAGPTICWIFIVLHCIRIAAALGVHSFQIFIGATYLGVECAQPLDLWNLAFGIAALVGTTLSIVLVPLSLNTKEFFGACRCLNLLRAALELSALILGTVWIFLIDDTSKCDANLYSETVLVVVLLWVVVGMGFIFTVAALISILCCLLN